MICIMCLEPCPALCKHWLMSERSPGWVAGENAGGEEGAGFLAAGKLCSVDQGT